MASYDIDFDFEFFNSSFIINDTLSLCCVSFNLHGFASLGLAEVSANNFSSDVLTFISSYGSSSAISSWDMPNGVRSVSADGYNSFTDTSIGSSWPNEGFISCMNAICDFSYIHQAEFEAFGMNASASSTIHAPKGSLTNGSAFMLVQGEGTLGFYQTSIYGSGAGSNITMVLDGFLTGYGATLQCRNSDHCVVGCLGYDSCFNLTLDCDDDAVCIVYNCDNGGSIG